nr:hypothetical protein [Tanacetum cinerariifolium]
MVSSVKLPILKKGGYILWTMKIEQYLAHTDYALWEVILNGNSAVQMTKDEAGNEVEGLDKGYDRFQRLLSLLEIHGARVSTEDTNQAFLRSIPSAKSNISLIMRNKPDIDNLDIYDLYNNLKVYEADIKGSYGSSSNSQNVAFISAESTSSTNELNAAYSVSTATGHSSQAQGSSSYADELMDYRIARNSGNRSRDAGNAGYKGRDNGKRPAREEDEKALVVQDRLGTYDWSYQVEEEATNFALMAFTSNPSSSSSLNFEREKLRKANLKIVGNQYGLESIEGQLREVLKYDVKDKSNLLKLTQKQLDEALREKEDLKAKLEKFETSLKNLTKLLDSQISAKVKTGLGYDSQFNENEVLDVKEEEVTETVFDNRSSDEENSLANDRFKKGEGYHAVPPPITRNYMPPKSDQSFTGLDDFIYKFKISETITSLTKDEKDALETSTAFVEKTKEVRTSAPLIQDWDTDSDNDNVFRPTHIPAKIDFVKADKMDKKSVLPNNVGNGIGHKESRAVRNNFQRINHQNKFAPTAVFTRLVPSCFVIFDLYPLSLSFDFVFSSKIFKSLSFCLDRFCHLAILCLDHHAHTLHHLETLLTISLDRLDILKEDIVYQSLRKSLSLCLSFLDS